MGKFSEMSKHDYLKSAHTFKIFAHRGLIYSNDQIVYDENTIPAFQAAADLGIEYLELDVQCTADGQAVVFHDETIDRVSGGHGKVADYTLTELKAISLLHGGHISTLAEVFGKFLYVCKINIDVKDKAAIPDIVAAVNSYSAKNRVLLTSFSEARRSEVLRAVPGVATSPSASLLLKIWFGYRFKIGFKKLVQTVNVLQIPVSYGPIRFDSPKFVESVKRHGVELVYWTINDPAEAKRLQQIGANGIVTDRSDLMVSALKLA